eukprot:TRINITY_DN11652_c0_g1_i2.p1 TRINITY_DN11652_c0_g1~~TRINITY_DN11652_c0_g1_i2.p1  ORF type:complete len:305 (+),score=79.38 TRINITY_DN11652_c0_g1_i2:118-915(+)
MATASHAAAAERAFAALCNRSVAHDRRYDELVARLRQHEEESAAAGTPSPAGRWRDPIVDSSAAPVGANPTAAALWKLHTGVALSGGSADVKLPTAGMYLMTMRQAQGTAPAEELLAHVSRNRPDALTCALFNAFFTVCGDDSGAIIRGYDTMRRRRVRPDADTFALVLSGLLVQQKEGAVVELRQVVWAAQQAVRFWEDMRKFRVPATVRTHSLLLKLLPPTDDELINRLFSDLAGLGVSESAVGLLRRHRETLLKRWEQGEWP